MKSEEVSPCLEPRKEGNFGQYDLQRVVFSVPKFLQSIQAFEANALARQALRSIQTLTISGSELGGHNLLELIISLPALRYLDVSNSHLDLRQLLLSCYYFHPLLETVIFSKTTQSQTVVVDVPDESVQRFQTRESRIRAKLLQTIKENAMLADQDVANKNQKLLHMLHMQDNEKRCSLSLHTLVLWSYLSNECSHLIPSTSSNICAHNPCIQSSPGVSRSCRRSMP